MVDETDKRLPRRFNLKDVPGTTVALTSLAVLGAAAIVTTPVWLWYRRKRKRTDALLRKAPKEATTSEQAISAGGTEPAQSSGGTTGDK